MSEDYIENLKDFKKLKCLLCGTRLNITRHRIIYPFSLKHSFIKAIAKETKDQQKIIIPLCKECHKKASRWKVAKKISEFLIWIFISFNLVSLLLFILSLISGVDFPFYIGILIIISLITLALGLVLHSVLKNSEYNPSSYLKLEKNEKSIILVKPPSKKSWIPYKVWLGYTYLEGLNS